jgi:hypothetical protein
MADEKKMDAEKEEKKDAAKSDAHNDPGTESGGGGGSGSTLDKMLSKLDDCMKRMDAACMKVDSMSSRMDAMEEDKKKDSAKADAEDKKEEKKDAKKDAKADESKDEKKEEKKDASEDKDMAKEVAADKKKDASEDKKEEKKDAKGDAMADSNEDIRKALADMQKQLPAAMSDEDYHAMADSQERADRVFTAFGGRAPIPLRGESNPAYRRRLATKLKPHSSNWKAIDLALINDDAFTVAESQIYADALNAANRPDSVPDGQLRMITRTMPSGHTEHTFVGSPQAWMGNFARGRSRFATMINPKPHQS